MRNDFAVFIMSYGRPDKIPSLVSLQRSGYTGKYFIIIGDDDPKLASYQTRFGDKCIVFNKADYIDRSDRMGLKITKVIMFARNACFDIAESLGLKFFQQFDDDYVGFFFSFNEEMKYVNSNNKARIKNYDRVVENMLGFYEQTTKQCLAITFSQGGDFIGGAGNDPETRWNFGSLRKAMNSWICSVDRRFNFSGCMNEDVNAYTTLQTKGFFFLNLMQYRLAQPVTQSTGGMSEVYRKYGTHVKSFLTVMLNPSFVKVSVLSHKHQRIHHRIDWNQVGSRIIRHNHKKK